jgi:hypothetical protein
MMGDSPQTMDNSPPTADVYAGDTTALDAPTSRPTRHSLFVIEAECEPHVLARVAGIFNIANVAPQNANLVRRSSSVLTISVAIEIGQATAEAIRRKLEQLTCVLSVTLADQPKSEARVGGKSPE